MKAKKIYITITFDWVPGMFDYPQNTPIPRIGELITFDTDHSHGCHHGRVYDIRHNISDTVATITIKVKRDVTNG